MTWWDLSTADAFPCRNADAHEGACLMLKSNRSIAKAEAAKLDLSTRVSVEAQIIDARAVAVERTRFERMETRYARWVAATSWRQHLFGFLGPLDGKVILDIGCGYAMTPIVFALA